MFTTKEQFDAHTAMMAEKLAHMMALDRVIDLLETCYISGDAKELKFLFDMPLEQRQDWVTKAVALYSDLHEADPEKYDMCGYVELVSRVRAYRKERNAKKRAEAKQRKEENEQFLKELFGDGSK